MLRHFAKPKTLAFTLLFFSAIPIMMGAVRVLQIPSGNLPLDDAKFLIIPYWHWFHALSGFLFGVLGPIQFARVLQNKFGKLHRISGRVFVVAGMVLGLSGVGIFAQVPNSTHLILDVMRVTAGFALVLDLAIAMYAIRKRDIAKHKAWMIRSYAIGMGAGAISIVMFPIYIITGAPIEGLLSDIVFVSCWLSCVGLAELIIARFKPTTRASAVGPNL